MPGCCSRCAKSSRADAAMKAFPFKTCALLLPAPRRHGRAFLCGKIPGLRPKACCMSIPANAGRSHGSMDAARRTPTLHGCRRASRSYVWWNPAPHFLPSIRISPLAAGKCAPPWRLLAAPPLPAPAYRARYLRGRCAPFSWLLWMPTEVGTARNGPARRGGNVSAAIVRPLSAR